MLLPDGVIIIFAHGFHAVFGMDMEAIMETSPAGTTFLTAKMMGVTDDQRASADEFLAALVAHDIQLSPP